MQLKTPFAVLHLCIFWIVNGSRNLLKQQKLPVESLADEMIRGRTAFTYFCT